MQASRPSSSGGGVTLPTAAAADELLRSTGAGTTYAAEEGVEFIARMLGELVSKEPAGGTFIADGAGGIGPTSDTVSDLLASANETEIRSVVGLVDLPVYLPLCSYGSNTGALTAHGLFRFDPDVYALPGRTLVIDFVVVGSVVSGVDASVVLRDVTNSADAATLGFTETAITPKSTGVTAPVAPVTYEVRSVVNSGTGYVAFSAVLRLTWS